MTGSGNKALEDEEEELTVPIPPDGGWGWVIVIASLFSNVIVDGVCFSFGIFFMEFMDYFKGSSSKTALIGSLIPGMYLGMGPVAAALANQFGCRPVAIAGSIVASVGFILSTFSPSLDILILTYGIIGGFGFGLMYLPSILIVNFYFEKRRALANGIAVCGSGIGTFIFAPFARFLVDEYGWKGGNLLLAAIILNGVAIGAIFRPLSTDQYFRDSSKRRKYLESERGNSVIIQRIVEQKNRQRTISTGSLDGGLITKDNLLIKSSDTVRMQALKNTLVLKMQREEEERKLLESTAETNKSDGESANKDIPVAIEQEPIEEESEEDECKVTNGVVSTKVKLDVETGQPEQKSNRHQQKVREFQSSREGRRRLSSIGSTGRRISMSMGSQSLGSHRDISRPLYRDDILYTGSMASLAKSVGNSQKIYTSHSSIPQHLRDDLTPMEGRLFHFKEGLIRMLDFRLLTSPTFCILCTTSVLAMLGFFTPFVYIVRHANSRGISPYLSTYLLSVLGASNVVGRLLAGFLSDLKRCDCILIHNLSLVLAGSATCLVPLFSEFYMLCVYCTIFGSCIGSFIALRSPVLVKLFGVETLNSSFGLLLLFQGVASLVGSPLAGWVVDSTQSYTVSFILSGILIAFSGFLSAPARTMVRWENRNRQKRVSQLSLNTANA